MPVNSTHPLYDQFAESWQRVRDVLAGEDAVKGGGALCTAAGYADE